MSSKLFVGNLSYKLTDGELEEIFSEFGDVSSAKVITDRRSGRSKGFGFVEMTSDDSARNAVEGLNGKEVKGRQIRVNFAREREGGFSDSRRGEDGFSNNRREEDEFTEE